MLATLKACCCWPTARSKPDVAATDETSEPSSDGPFRDNWSYSGPETPPAGSGETTATHSPETDAVHRPRQVVMYIKPYPDRPLSL